MTHWRHAVLRSLTPDLICESLCDVDLDALHERGIRSILLDLDNTVCRWKCDDISEGTADWVRRARERFSLCIVSNSIRPKRLNRIAEALGIPSVGRWGLGRKPFKGGIRATLKLLAAAPNETAMIGDQIMTDIWGGNRMGLYTIWVRPLCERDFIGTRPARFIERLLVAHFRRLGILPEGWRCA